MYQLVFKQARAFGRDINIYAYTLNFEMHRSNSMEMIDVKKKCIYIMAGYLSYPSLLGINKPCLSSYVSPGDNTISSRL